MKRIQAVEFSEKIKNGEPYIVLDIRETYERTISQIDSIHIPMDQIVSRYTELPVDKNIVVMCRTGNRAEAVVNLLENKYKMPNLFLMDGGLISWIEYVDQSLEKY